MKKTAPAVIFYLLIFISFCTCGIDDYPYIYAIPQANARQEMNSWATVDIPGDNSSSIYFTHFAIYYRIYVSDTVEISPSKSNIYAINSTLNSHYARVEPYIENDSAGNSSISSLFSNMGYYTIALEGADIDSELGSSALNRTIIFDFTQTAGSTLTIGSAPPRKLMRSNVGGNNPRPTNRYFVNAPELNDSSNIGPNVNADITDKSGGFTPRYTYVNLYIVAVGIDTQTYTQIFSTPTFIGILKLPDPS